MTEASFCLIAANEIDETQRRQITALVKENSDDWWHQYEDVWVTRNGGTADDWRDRLRPILVIGQSGVIVFALPPETKHWASFGPKDSWIWFKTHYVNGPIPALEE